MKHPVFIISTGRTGTTFLAETLNRLGARAAHEPGPSWLRLLSNAYVSGDVSLQRATALVQKARGPEKTWDVEASCLVYGLTRPILEVHPGARVVHLIRDPRTYIRSAMNWGVHRPGGRPLNLMPFRRLTPPQMEGRSVQGLLEWTRRDQFSRICWTWRAQNEAMHRDVEGDERCLTLRMEDLFDSSRGYPGFMTILRLAEVPAPPLPRLETLLAKKVNEAPKQTFPPWKEWSSRHLEELLDECADLAGSYGYPVREEVGAELADRLAD